MEALTDPNDKPHSGEKRTILAYEILGMVFIILLGSALHFTFEFSGNQPLVGIFSAVNESVWEHLKLAFWPTLLFTLIEYVPLMKKGADNFALAKTVGVYSMIIIIPIVFYSYTAFTAESILAVDISTFAIAVVIGQIASYELLTRTKASPNLTKISILAFAVLTIAFVAFTFDPPRLGLFQDPITGKYGIP